MIHNLEGVDNGKFLVTTQHGTTHVLDLDNSTVTRRGAPGRAWDGSNGAGADGVPFRFWTISGWNGTMAVAGQPEVQVGQRMYINNREAWRLTSEVVSIELYTE